VKDVKGCGGSPRKPERFRRDLKGSFRPGKEKINVLERFWLSSATKKKGTPSFLKETERSKKKFKLLPERVGFRCKEKKKG